MTQGIDSRPPFQPDSASSSSAGYHSGIPPGERVLQPGERLGGFQIQEMVGAGGMAVVYKALQLSLNRPIALKVLNSRFSRDPAFVQRFDQEAGALAALNHPNIVNIIDKGRDQDLYYFVMEFIPGTSLDKAIVEGRLTLTDYIIIISGIRDALSYVHSRGIVHRDIKPANILLSDEGRVKVSDFGIAHIAWGDPKLQKSGKNQFGTSYYMAPEQAEQGQKIDNRADIYALGVTFYKMFTRELPQGAFTGPSVINPTLPPDLDPILFKALQQSPAQRYQSVEEFCDDLLSVLWERSGLAKGEGDYQGAAVTPDLVGRPTPLPVRPTSTFPGLASPPAPPSRPRTAQPIAPVAPAPAPIPVPLPSAIPLEKPKEAKRKEKPTEAGPEISLPGEEGIGRKKIMVAIITAAVVLAIAGGGYYYWTVRQKAAAGESALADLGDKTKPSAPGPTSPDQGANPFEGRTVKPPVETPSIVRSPTPTLAPTPEAPLEPVLVSIPAGPVRIGDIGSRWASPPHVVQLPAFQIDKYEVTNWMYARFVKATGYAPPPCWKGGIYPEGQDNYPVVEVSLNDARAYAKWAGRDIPTEEQWERAARGINGWNYPWGQEWRDGAANLLTGRLLPVNSPGWLDVTLEASGDGCVFMAGNVMEWTQSNFTPYPGCGFRDPAFSTTAVVVRGGAFIYRSRDPLNPAYLARAGARSYVPGPDIRMDNLGFRCVSNAP